MLGNDIVDLQKADVDSNWRRKGYLDRIFSTTEKQRILNSVNPSILVWLFWSMKEATYKIINRATGQRFYSPQLFTCTNTNFGELSFGEVHYQGKIYTTQSVINENLIHTVSFAADQKAEGLDIIYLANIKPYLPAFERLSTGYDLIKNKHGIPVLIHRDTGASHMTSLSHHGKYLALAYLKF